MYGQEAQIMQTKGFENVRLDYIMYDAIRIGTDVPTNVPGWFSNLTNLANSDNEISFFNVRQASEAGDYYTNVVKKTGLDFPCIFTDFGIGFFYPDPVNTQTYDGDRAAAKVFQSIFPQHCSLSLYIAGSDNKILTIRPEMAPYGFGPSGNQIGGVVQIEYSSLITNGIPLAGNRFRFANLPLKLPKDIAVKAVLNLSNTAKTILRAMDTVKPMVFEDATWTNECLIVCAYRGIRDIQQLGELHF